VNAKDVPLQQASILLQPATCSTNDSLTHTAALKQTNRSLVQSTRVFCLLIYFFLRYLGMKSTFIFVHIKTL
jgi:hypothetical protein